MRTFLTATLLAFLGWSAAAASEPDVDARLAEAQQDLEMLDDMLDDDDATNREVIAYMDVVLEAALGITLPPLPDEADDALRRARRKRERDLAALRDDTLDLLLEALDETELDASGHNVREPVNEHAGPLLGRTGPLLEDEDAVRRLSRRVIRKIKRLEKARHDVAPDVFEGAFLALVRLGDLRSFSWLVDNHLHARKKPEEVRRLRGALRALHEFKGLPGEARRALVDRMVKLYQAMESLAGQSTTDVSAQAARRFWDQVGTDVVKLLQKAAGYPKSDEGVALSSVGDIARWYRKHDRAGDAAWRDPAKGE